jgi:hypothetical protein
MNVDKSPKNEEEFSLFATSQKKFHSKALEYFQNRRDVHHYPYERFVSATSSLSSSSSRDADLLAKKE